MPDPAPSIRQLLALWLRRAAHVLDRPESVRLEAERPGPPRQAKPIAIAPAPAPLGPPVGEAADAQVAPPEVSPMAPASADQEAAMRAEVEQLVKNALEARTPEAFTAFLDFMTRFRRLSVWNARMAQIQRPGARALASEHEWRSIGRRVAADAAPIIILWPFGPIRYVYEVGDTLPAIDRSAIGDPFATEGALRPGVMDRLAQALRHQKHFRVDVERRRFGLAMAGSVAGQGNLALEEQGEAVQAQGTLGLFAKSNAQTTQKVTARGIPSYRVLINDRLTEPQQFVTLAHELGHAFCGHLGACHGGRSGQEESGWPDRRALGHDEREIEAEGVAYIVAKRAGIVTRSVDYLAPHVNSAELNNLDVDLVVRAAARIERLAKIRYGRMDFAAEPAGMK